MAMHLEARQDYQSNYLNKNFKRETPQPASNMNNPHKNFPDSQSNIREPLSQFAANTNKWDTK